VTDDGRAANETCAPTIEILAPQNGLHRWAAVANGLIGRAVDTAVAILIVTEVLVLFAGVVARYLLRSPLVWSDELASILFLWLAMLGAVVAFRRSEHMRMTTFVAMAPPIVRSFLQHTALSISFVFLLLLAIPSIEYARRSSSSRPRHWKSTILGALQRFRSGLY
jgi:TRAP-type C4-dicarboxylate transport system permease small subunit